MSIIDLQDEIVVKTTEGDFRLLKNGRLEELPSQELMVPEEEIVPYKEEETKKFRNKEIKENLVNANLKPTAEFYIDPEDKREADKFKNGEMEEKNKRIKEFIEMTVREIMDKANLEAENQQAKNIIISRLKDVRTIAATKESLARMDFDRDQIERIMALIESKREKVEEAIRSGRTPEIRNQKLEIRNTKKDTIRIQEKELAGVEYKRRPEVVGTAEISRRVTMGPVLEIKNMTLTEFRKLGEGPEEAAERIMEKIGLLEDESLIKKFEGINGWKQCEVYRVYIAIGAKSMAERKTIEQVIREFEAGGKPYLAPREFNAVADLNRRLSY